MQSYYTGKHRSKVNYSVLACCFFSAICQRGNQVCPCQEHKNIIACYSHRQRTMHWNIAVPPPLACNPTGCMHSDPNSHPVRAPYDIEPCLSWVCKVREQSRSAGHFAPRVLPLSVCLGRFPAGQRLCVILSRMFIVIV